MTIGRHEKPNKGGTDIWLTPLSVVHSLGQFDLDPCGEDFHATAKTIYTERGLDKPWFGRVWLNPPYSDVRTWLIKLRNHGNGVALVFARLDTKGAQEILPSASSVFFPRGRLYFLTRELEKKGNAGAPSMFLSFGHTPEWAKVGSGIAFKNPIKVGEP